jgi:hypothetical protein
MRVALLILGILAASCHSPPPPVQELKADQDAALALSWKNPSEARGVLIARGDGHASGSAPKAAQHYSVGEPLGSSTIVFIGEGERLEQTGLCGAYTYEAWSFDKKGNWSTGTLLEVRWPGSAPPPPDAIQGADSSCESATGVKYAVPVAPGAAGYAWKVPASATITSGQGSPVVTVDFAASEGDVSVARVNNCGESQRQIFPVTLMHAPPPPEALTGPVKVCAFPNEAPAAYGVTPVPGAESYEWQVPADATIVSGDKSAQIFVKFASASGDVSVRAHGPCGVSPPTVRTVQVGPPKPAGEIVGPASVCAGATGVRFHDVDEPKSDETYVWFVPVDATIDSGQGTSAITVSFSKSSGLWQVRTMLQSDCGGSRERIWPVAVASDPPPAPGSIVGPSRVAADARDVAYSVPPVEGASTYVWTLPSGASITSGAGSASIAVSFAGTLGTLAVQAQNGCGTSAAAKLTISPAPAK